MNNIKDLFIDMYKRKAFTDDNMLELIGSSFIVEKDHFFGEPSYKYIKAEIKWYESMSLNVWDIKKYFSMVPKIWLNISAKGHADGRINSNYGWCIFSKENGNQYDYVLRELRTNPNSRRGSMIYQRPNMHTDSIKYGMNDFVCTWGVQYYIRSNRLHCVVNMRSNDIIFGFNNDYAWQKYVLDKLANDLNIECGDITWQANSLHMYERHFHLIEKEIENGN